MRSTMWQLVLVFCRFMKSYQAGSRSADVYECLYKYRRSTVRSFKKREESNKVRHRAQTIPFLLNTSLELSSGGFIWHCVRTITLWFDCCFRAVVLTGAYYYQPCTWRTRDLFDQIQPTEPLSSNFNQFFWNLLMNYSMNIKDCMLVQ